MRRSMLFVFALGCGSSAPAPAPPKPEASPCDKLDLAKSESPDLLKCAGEALERREYATVTTIADAVIERYPYSVTASKGQELKADILYLRGQFAEAAAAYRSLVIIASGARIEELRTKQEAAEAKAAKPTR